MRFVNIFINYLPSAKDDNAECPVSQGNSKVNVYKLLNILCKQQSYFKINNDTRKI